MIEGMVSGAGGVMDGKLPGVAAAAGDAGPSICAASANAAVVEALEVGATFGR